MPACVVCLARALPARPLRLPAKLAHGAALALHAGCALPPYFEVSISDWQAPLLYPALLLPALRCAAREVEEFLHRHPAVAEVQVSEAGTGAVACGDQTHVLPVFAEACFASCSAPSCAPPCCNRCLVSPYCTLCGGKRASAPLQLLGFYPLDAEAAALLSVATTGLQVFGVPDPRMGEELCAWVRPRWVPAFGWFTCMPACRGTLQPSALFTHPLMEL